MNIVDAGACRGDFFKKYLAPENEIWAFEPFPVNVQNLLKEFGEVKNVHIIGAALGGELKNIRLYNNGWEQCYGYVGASMYADNIHIKGGKYSDSFTIRLSYYWKAYIQDPVDILKLDIEGAEYEVIEDLLKEGVINQFKTIRLEEHADCIPSLAGIRSRIMPQLLNEFKGKLFIKEWSNPEYQEVK